MIMFCNFGKFIKRGLPMGFPEVGTWNSTHNVSLNDMNLDARMVRMGFNILNTVVECETKYAS